MDQIRHMTRTILLAVFVTFFLCRCVSSRKFDYHTAYKFNYIEHHPDDNKPGDLIKLEPRWDEIYVSALENPNLKAHIPTHKFEVSRQHQPGSHAVSVDTRKSIISKKEKRELKAEFKSIIKSIRRNDVKKMEMTSDYRNTHPAFKGFIFVVIGFGVILASVLINLGTLSAILLVVGFIIIGYGLLKILMNR